MFNCSVLSQVLYYNIFTVPLLGKDLPPLKEKISGKWNTLYTGVAEGRWSVIVIQHQSAGRTNPILEAFLKYNLPRLDNFRVFNLSNSIFYMQFLICTKYAWVMTVLQGHSSGFVWQRQLLFGNQMMWVYKVHQCRVAWSWTYFRVIIVLFRFNNFNGRSSRQCCLEFPTAHI